MSQVLSRVSSEENQWSPMLFEERIRKKEESHTGLKQHEGE